MSDTTTDTGTGETFRLVYTSHDLIEPSDRRVQLGALFTGARSNNKKLGITGALLVTDESFVQALEGDEVAVRELFAHIEKDGRHDQVAVLEAGEVPERVFARWAMAEVAHDPADPDTALIAHEDGISPASGRRITPEQDIVLTRMRAAARGEVRSG